MTTISVAPAAFAPRTGGVDLLGVEDPALVVELLAAGDLLPLDDAGDALHVADDVDAHGRDDNVTPWRRDWPARACS
jgi:hypothetical protein